MTICAEGRGMNLSEGRRSEGGDREASGAFRPVAGSFLGRRIGKRD